MNDMEFSKSPVSVCEQSKQLKTKTNLEADVIVPDTKPDIYRVLNVKALPDVTECYMKKDKIIFSGKTKFTILYVGEGDMGKICSIEYSLPFNHLADMAGAEEGSVARSSCNISSTAFDIKNSRKLSTYSQDSVTKTSLEPITRLLPLNSLTPPPTMIVGSSPASKVIIPAIDVVVVLP